MKCLRCDSEYNENNQNWHCNNNCKLNYVYMTKPGHDPRFSNEKSLYSVSINTKTGFVEWNFRNKTCRYADTILKQYSKPFFLPWLPFNITEEKIEFYLTFF